MKNLVSLVAWHDSGWNGYVCRNPNENKYCESFGYVKYRKNMFCRKNPGANLGCSNKKACSEAVMFCEENVIDGGRMPGIFFENNPNVKKEITEQLNMVINKYALIYVRENPLSDNRVIIGCVRIREIKNLVSRDNIIGFDIDFDVDRDIIFTLPYQELLEFCKDNNIKIPEELIFEVGEFERYFKGMSNFISDEILVQVLKKGLSVLEKFNEFINQHPDFKKYLVDENIAFRPHIFKKFEEFIDNIRRTILEIESSEYKYPGLPGVLYYLGMHDAYSRYLDLWKNFGTSGEEMLYNALLESLKNKKENIKLGITENVINNYYNQPEDFREFLINYAVYYELSAYKIEKIFEQCEKGFINIKKVLDNPYTLVEDLKENDSFERIIFEEFDKWEKRRLENKFNIYNPFRIRGLLVEILKRHLLLGNTAVSVKDIQDIFEKMDNDIVKISFEKFINLIKKYESIISDKVEISKKEIKYDGNVENIELFSLKDIRKYEKIVEEAINKLLNKKTPNIELNITEIKKELNKPEGVSDEEYERAVDIQTNAVINLLKNRVGILTGPAGSGKTTVIKTIIKFMKNNLKLKNILILTPTGKSAMVVKKTVGSSVDVKTIHRYIAKEFNSYFDFDYYILNLDNIEDDKKEIDALIIDESSMVDIETLGNLLGTIKLKNLKYLIFVGDVNQLPPVGAGKPFYDIYKYLEKVNPEAICKLEIVLSADSKKIVELSKLFLDINREEKIKLLNELLKNKEILKNGNEVYRIKENINDSEREIITIEVVKDGNIKNSLENAINCILSENNTNDFFKFCVFDDRLQILTPTKTKGEFGSYIINLFIRQDSRFVPNNYKRKMLGKWFFGDNNVADKVIQIKNSYNKWVYNIDTHKWERSGVFNGMMGYVYCYNNKTIVKFYYPKIEAYADEKEMEHAYAITIHKSQGSRFENVILVLPKGLDKFISKEMIYTAITRAKKRLYIIVEEDIKNLFDVKISELAKRKTNLFENFNLSHLIPYIECRDIITLNGEKVRSWQECILANMFYNLDIDYIYEPISEFLELGILPDFKLLLDDDKTILWEHYGMSTEEYLRRQKEKENIYRNLGFEIIRLAEINNDTKLGDKILITSTTEDLKDNLALVEKLKLLKEKLTNST